MGDVTDIIKCLRCGHVLVSGIGMIAVFGPGTSIECRKCGNKHIFGQKESPREMGSKNGMDQR